MAVEIRELVIRAVIVDGKDVNNSAPGSLDHTAKQEIIQACVDQVLKIIRREKLR